MSNPLNLWQRLVGKHTAAGRADAERWALRELLFGGRRAKRRHYERAERTTASARRKRRRKMAHESRRRNRAVQGPT